MEERKVLSTVEEIKAVSDPYRYKILNCFHSVGVPSTVKQIADRMGEVPAKVYYHVKKMEAAGILCLHHTQEVNGIVAKYYELAAATFDIRHEDGSDSSGLFLSEAQQMVSQMYTSSRDLIIETISKNKGNREKIDATLSTQEIYITRDQAKELANFIVKFSDENREKNQECEEKYHYFFSLFCIE